MSNSPFYEAGNYMGTIIGQGLSKAKTGTAQFVLEVRILGFQSSSGVVELEKQYSRTIYMALTERTVEFVGHTLRALGFRGQSFGPLDPAHPEHQSFFGKNVELSCEHESYNGGAPREKWRINDRKSLNITPLRAEEISSLDRQFASKLSHDNTAPASSGFAAQTEISDDDIPF